MKVQILAWLVDGQDEPHAMLFLSSSVSLSLILCPYLL